LVELGGRWGYVDEAAGTSSIPSTRTPGAFSEGVAAVKSGTRMGYIDRSGAVVIPPQFDDEGEFSQGLARVVIGGRTGFHRPEGPAGPQPAVRRGPEVLRGAGARETGRPVEVHRSRRQGVIDVRYDEYTDFTEGFALVKSGGKYGFIDKSGKLAIQAQFDNALQLFPRAWPPSASGAAAATSTAAASSRSTRSTSRRPFTQGLGRVRQNGKWGYIDKAGKFVIQAPVRPGLLIPEGGLAEVELGGARGYIGPGRQVPSEPVEVGRGARPRGRRLDAFEGAALG